ncbi:PLC-like phosphodiesterase [Setomelanomma holmii]|uniref:PLC-like phosphodiesterase n=1 Tax=Setomelanomma holmii TaxID=210430 RepID=A0A9P4HKM4_9PLEO|nr:PLC-like phosphodiesterase [Setomelanomma holmii]
MSAPITIRNLTATSISIKRVEHFEDPNAQQSKASGYLFSSRHTTPAAPSLTKLGEHAESFTYQDLDVDLAPFESYTLHIKEQRRSNNAGTTTNDALRLTIESMEGHRHRIGTQPSYTQKSSQPSLPLSGTSSATYTALFHPSRPTAHLTIHSHRSFDYTNWMSTLPANLPLSAISIPGTHNSHTHYRALPSVRCQVVDIAMQLANGIRFLDIRLQPVQATDTTKKDLYLVHGAFPVSLTGPKYFAPIVQTCYAFLSTHPSETILISLKREGVGGSTDEHFAQILEEHYIKPNASKWYTDTHIPYLSATRGKLVLVRRYTQPSHAKPLGLDATSWPYNATHALFPSPQANFCLQDFCEILVPGSIPTKIQVSNEHLVRAAECQHHIPGVTTDMRNPVPPGPLYLNFLSGSNFWNRRCWPENIAREVNRGTEEWLCVGHHLDSPEGNTRTPERLDEIGGGGVRRKKAGDGGTGIVVMDCVGESGNWDLVRLVVGMNIGVLEKCRGKV